VKKITALAFPLVIVDSGSDVFALVKKNFERIGKTVTFVMRSPSRVPFCCIHSEHEHTVTLLHLVNQMGNMEKAHPRYIAQSEDGSLYSVVVGSGRQYGVVVRAMLGEESVQISTIGTMRYVDNDIEPPDYIRIEFHDQKTSLVAKYVKEQGQGHFCHVYRYDTQDGRSFVLKIPIPSSYMSDADPEGYPTHQLEVRRGSVLQSKISNSSLLGVSVGEARLLNDAACKTPPNSDTREGYQFVALDFWQIGVCILTLLCGCNPFMATEGEINQWITMTDSQSAERLSSSDRDGVIFQNARQLLAELLIVGDAEKRTQRLETFLLMKTG